jgi:hypothetical protein
MTADEKPDAAKLRVYDAVLQAALERSWRARGLSRAERRKLHRAMRRTSAVQLRKALRKTRKGELP